MNELLLRTEARELALALEELIWVTVNQGEGGIRREKALDKLADAIVLLVGALKE